MDVRQLLESLSEEDIKNYKENAIEMDTWAGQSLEDIVIKLEKLRRQGKFNYYANFNGTKLYSLDVTMNRAFRECLNCSRKTWLKNQKKNEEETEKLIAKLEKKAQQELPTWIEEEKKYIHSEKISNWKNICIGCANGDYYGLEIESALEIMKMLEDGQSLKKIKEKVLEDGHSGATYSRTMNIVLLYANRGPALFKFMNRRYCYNEGKKYVEKIEEINKKLLMGYKYDDAIESLKEHKIMDISIAEKLPENFDGENIGKYSREGTILIDEENCFEGILNDQVYVTGQILENGCISLATFNNYIKPSHYYGIVEGSIVNAKRENYSIAHGIVDAGNAGICLLDSDKNYADEIVIEEKIAKIKDCFDEDVKGMYDWFCRNFNSESQRSVSIIRENLNQRLVNAIGSKMSEDSVAKNQEMVLKKVKK